MNIHNLQNKIRVNNGFTIIETLVAIAILMISIAGPLTVSQKGYNAGIQARDQVTASYLAQDAMEYIKNIRDNNKMASPGRDWLYGITDIGCLNSTSIDNICTVDTVLGDPRVPLSNGISPCSADDNSCVLNLGDNGYTHSSSGTTPTKYIRYFYVTQSFGVEDEATLTVVVRWTTDINNQIIYENRIFDVTK